MKNSHSLRRVGVSILLFGCLAMLLAAGGLLVPQAGGESSASAAAPAVPAGVESLIREIATLTGGSAAVSLDAETGRARFVRTEPSRPVPQPAKLSSGQATPEQAARGFLSRYGSLFGLSDQASQVSAVGSAKAADGRSFVRFQQVHNNVRVMGGELIVQVAARGNGILSANGETVADPTLDVSPTVSSSMARKNALTAVAKYYDLDDNALRCGEPALWIYNPSLLGMNEDRSSLVWRTEVENVNGLPIRELVLVDASLGFVALHFNQVETAKSRRVYDANCTGTLPGTLVRSEGQSATGDADVDNAYKYTGYAYDFYWTNHGRDSIDNAGMKIVSTVNYDEDGGCDYENAFWNGSQLVFGTGFTSACDLVAHELTHGVTEHESNLFYYMQSGAISESFSDIWGEFTELTYNAGPTADRWLCGEDLAGGAARSMKDPPAYGQPDKVTSPYYVCGGYSSDGGGVHTNSGVVNKAAYLMVDGGSFNGYVVTGMGISKTADLFYEVQTNMLTSGSDYADLYDALQQAAVNLGYGAADRQTIKNAIDAVEMDQQPPSCPAIEDPVSDHRVPVMLFSDDLEDPDSGNWVTYSASGSSYWGLADFYATSGQYSIWGYDCSDVAEYYVAMTTDVALPEGKSSLMHFRHSFEFDCEGSSFYDGGLVEYSTDGGSTWLDIGWAYEENPYVGEIDMWHGNPLGGRKAFVGRSNGYCSSTLDISSLAGESIRFRFGIGTDSSVDSLGWFIDDVQIYTLAPDTTPPPAPVLLAPTASWVNDSTSTMDWTDVTDPAGVTYQLEISSRPDFSYVELYRGSLTESTFTRTMYLPDGTYYWMVRAVDGVGNEGPWSSVWAFGLDNTVPSVPILATPGNGQVTTDSTPALDWSDVTEPSGVTYTIQIDDDADCASPFLSHALLGESAYTVTAAEALADGTYCWRVRAVDGAGNGSDWSAPWSFAIGPAYPAWDINQDGKVDYKDLAMLGAHYGETTASPYPAWDINQDGVVNYKDLAMLGAHYGETY